VSISRIQLGPDGAAILPRLHTAARFLATTTSEELLETVISRPPLLQRALDLVTRIDHVGFMAPSQAVGELASAASRAGFDTTQRTFPSTIFARELGEAAGRDLVPTTIFKARGEPAGEAAPGVEVAMPHDVEPEVVRGWIREGFGEHVAFRVDSPWYFAPLRRLLEHEGFGMPAFMNGAALTNRFEKVTAVYFDRDHDPGLRLEFCCYG
jgi:hypothetical protein